MAVNALSRDDMPSTQGLRFVPNEIVVRLPMAVVTFPSAVP